MFAQLRTGLLAHSISEAGVAAVHRYRATADVRREVGELQAANLVDVADDGAITATDSGRGLLAVMYGVSAECASELWGSHSDTVAHLNRIAGLVIEAGILTGGEAFRALAPPYEPAGADVALVLHHRLSVLRYHRADAHAAAWHAAGQTAQTMAELPAGAERDRIEADTNRRAGIPYASLTVAERSKFVQGLASLPGRQSELVSVAPARHLPSRQRLVAVGIVGVLGLHVGMFTGRYKGRVGLWTVSYWWADGPRRGRRQWRAPWRPNSASRICPRTS